MAEFSFAAFMLSDSSSLFWIPAMPALSSIWNVMYGLQYASAERNSMEPSRPGAYSSCTSGMRFSSDQLMREGAAR